MIILGIDIGLGGAVAALDSRTWTARVVDLATVDTSIGRRLDGRALILLLRELAPHVESALVVAENVRPRPSPRGNTMHSEGSLLRSRGIVECATDICRLQVEWVEPQSWKRSMGLIGKEKKDSLRVARELFPDIADQDLGRVKDHNRAEALLIAKYGAGRFV